MMRCQKRKAAPSAFRHEGGPGRAGVYGAMKKSYRKPELKTRHLELGVFGDYSHQGRDSTTPSPISVIESLRMRME